jgi:nucleotide-binding universal stress UspA family protein
MNKGSPPHFQKLAIAVTDGPESQQALVAACRLAGKQSRLLLLTVVEVPALLPLDAQMEDEEALAVTLLAAAKEQAEAHGLNVTTKLLRAREAGEALLAEIERQDVELLAVGVRRHPGSHAAIIGTTTGRLLKHAPCRVLLVSLPDRGAGGSL